MSAQTRRAMSHSCPRAAEALSQYLSFQPRFGGVFFGTRRKLDSNIRGDCGEVFQSSSRGSYPGVKE